MGSKALKTSPNERLSILVRNLCAEVLSFELADTQNGSVNLEFFFFLQQLTANESAMEEELGLVGASAEDTEAELIRKICETELLAGKHCVQSSPIVSCI